VKDNSLALVMGKIIGEAEAGPKPDASAQPRHPVSHRVLGIIICLSVMGVLASAYCCRGELKKLFYSKPVPQAAGGAGRVAK